MSITVTDVEGNIAIIAENALETERVILRFENGKVVDIETGLLLRESDTHYLLPFLKMQTAATDTVSFNLSVDASEALPADAQVITLAEERVHVGRIERSETLRISKAVVENVVSVEEMLHHEDFTVERKLVSTYVSEKAQVRQEGDTTIIPVYEEVIVIERRWLLREEIHVTKQTTTRPFQQDVVVRREQVEINRIAHSDSEALPSEPRD